MLDRIINFFTSLKLTVACLCFALLLVFIGTLAQVDEGLYQAQARYFKSFFIYWSPPGAGWKIPVLPGGYFLGAVLLVNLLSAHAKRFKFAWKKSGILMIHAGLILLLLGQLLTDVLSRESAMRLSEGQSKNYSESFHENELALINTSNPDSDEVIAVPEARLVKDREIKLPQSPFTLRVKKYWANADLSTNRLEGAVESTATQGVGSRLFVLPQPLTAKEDERNMPSAVVEVLAPGGSLGTWLVSTLPIPRQQFTCENKTWQLALRFTRHYERFSIELVKFSHDKYKGTDIPKNFSSRIRLANPQNKENREVLIYMNNPLRYAGTTYYQGSFDKFDPRVSILQVVKNPGWLTPYLSCALVAAGLITQFMTHLIGFMKRRVA